MKLTLKVYRLGTIIECVFCVFLLSLIGFILYLRFFTDDYLGSFFYHHPYYVLMLCMIIFAGLCWILKECLLYLYKGYIVQLNADGIWLANGRFIPWYTIEYMDLITGYHRRTYKITFIALYTEEVESKNYIDFIVKRLRRGVLLRNFENTDEAYRVLHQYWDHYGN